jgi:hypothetical protein
VLWLLFAAAFLPTLADLARHLVAEPWALYCVLFFGLFGLEATRGVAERRRAGTGVTLVSLALVVEFVLVSADWTRMARPALAFGMIGIALALGRPPLRHGLLAFWAIPVPSAALAACLPWLEAVVRSVAPELPLAFANSTQVPSDVLTLRAQDSGLPLAVAMSGLGWYSAVRSDLASELGLRRAITWALLGLAIQACVVAIALATAASGAVWLARWALLLGPWLLAGVLGTAWVRWEHVRRGLSSGATAQE